MLHPQLAATAAVPSTAWIQSLLEWFQNRDSVPSLVWKLKLEFRALANIIPTRTRLEYKYMCMLCYKFGFFIFKSEGPVNLAKGVSQGLVGLLSYFK